MQKLLGISKFTIVEEVYTYLQGMTCMLNMAPTVCTKLRCCFLAKILS